MNIYTPCNIIFITSCVSFFNIYTLIFISLVVIFYELTTINNKTLYIVYLTLIISYIWAELGVGIFFQDTWGGN